MRPDARPTEVVHRELELGSWTRATRPPHPGLRGLMHRAHLGFQQHDASFERWLEAPRLALTLMVDLEGALRADGAALPDAWVGGLGERYTVVEFGSTYASIDLELTPFGAHAVLARPLHELASSVVGLEELFGADGRRLAEGLRDEPDWDRRFDLLDAFLARRAGDGPRPSPSVAWALGRLRASRGRARIETLAAELGCSRRHLLKGFNEQVGLPPKTVARLLRFEHVCRRLDADPVRWADIAYDCGYSDQSHLNRDFRDLAGTTPTDYLARRIPGGGVVGDEIPFVQDAGRTAA